MKRILSFIILTLWFWFVLVLSGCDSISVYQSTYPNSNFRHSPYHPIIILPHRPYHPCFRNPRRYRIRPHRYPSDGFHRQNGAIVRNGIIFLTPNNQKVPRK